MWSNEFTHFFNSIFEEAFPTTSREYKSEKVYSDGNKLEYFKNGRLHREDGPAVVYKDNSRPNEYYLNGKVATKDEIETIIRKKEEEKEHVIIVDGLRYYINGKQLKIIKDKLKEIL